MTRLKYKYLLIVAAIAFTLSGTIDPLIHDHVGEESHSVECQFCHVEKLDDVDIVESITQFFFTESIFSENRQPIITQTYRFFKSRAPPVTKV
tara:strand:- start:64 stop:342 length:279 start_codon:yes stop_codon:yes gene_type:complete